MEERTGVSAISRLQVKVRRCDWTGRVNMKKKSALLCHELRIDQSLMIIYKYNNEINKFPYTSVACT